MTYSELQALIADYLDRDLMELQTQIQGFITTTEAKLNRELRHGQMTTRAYTAGTDEPWYSFPDDYLALRSIKVDEIPLEYITPQQMTDFVARNPTERTRYYTIEARQYRIRPVPGPDARIEITYYQRIPALSDAAPVNWVLNFESDLYLYGSLAEAERYLKNDERVAQWELQYAATLDAIVQADKQDRWTGTPSRIRAMT